MRPLPLVLLACCTSPHSMAQASHGGQACSATATAAAAAEAWHEPVAVHQAAVPAASFRAEGMQVDPVLHRVWVRLRSCADAAWPAVLVPLPRSSEIQDTHPAAAGPSVAVAPSRTAVAQIVVHAGDAVNAIYDSSNIHLRLEAMANQQGAAGDTIALTLKRRPGQPLDEPEHRIHGIVRADKTVEVQP